MALTLAEVARFVPSPIRRYTHWLHTRWPAGGVERLPEVNEDGTTALAGVRVVGDLTGVPLLKFAADSGARAVQAIATERDFQRRDDGLDLAVVGGGISGIAAAIEAKKLGLRVTVFEASEPFSTVVNFPKAKPIYTYPVGMTPTGALQFRDEVHPKETLLADLQSKRTAAGIETVTARVERLRRGGDGVELIGADGRPLATARRVIVAIGKSGDHRRLNVPGEDLDKVTNRVFDPADYRGQQVLVVGGGDTALETATALAEAEATVTLSYRKPEFSRPKPENVERLTRLGDRVAVRFNTEVAQIDPATVTLRDGATGAVEQLPNDAVVTAIGSEAPLAFFRRSGIPIRREWRAATWAGFIGFFVFCCWLYTWKSGGSVTTLFRENHWFPFNLAADAADPKTLAGTTWIALGQPSFYYSLAYTLCVGLFGLKRIRRRQTPYVTRQTATLFAVQALPLFLLPFFILPLMGAHGVFDGGIGKSVADALFPSETYDVYGREYWRAYGLILAWPLFIWNVFTSEPMWTWLAISFVQTFVIIPFIVWKWGKGAYCGWICSCGALAETLGDDHREKMPHGPVWNRVNMVGQVVLAAAMLLFFARVLSWSFPNTGFGGAMNNFYSGLLSNWDVLGVQLNYYHVVDILLAGVVGVGFYFWFSGRVWCRFACPLAALMHIYGRFSRFRIFADKKKCISCNVCTSVCHQGIDVMAFANKGLPMEDPQCVRCSACVQSCPTGVLSFGYFAGDDIPILDQLPASPVQMAAGREVPTTMAP